MGRTKAGWKKLYTPYSEREKPMNEPPGEGGSRPLHGDEKKTFHKRRLKQREVPQEGGHSQASISEQENINHEGGHSQASNGIQQQNFPVTDGGHSQSSRGKKLRYGHHGRYNDTIDFI